MDKNVVAILKDYQSSIESSFKRIDKKLDSFDKYDKNQKKSAIISLKQELDNIKASMSMMKAELGNLNEPENSNIWEETVSKLKTKVKSYSEKIKDLDLKKDEPQDNNVAYTDPDTKVNYEELNAQQVMDRGDKILDADDNAIKNMANVVHQDIGHMKNVNIKLNEQQEKLENVDTDLKEIDYSLSRAGKQITSIFKMYSSDKCIISMIFVVVVIIVIIIIVSVCGGDNKKNFNVPHDIFSSNNNSTTNSGKYLFNSNILLSIIIFIFLYFS